MYQDVITRYAFASFNYMHVETDTVSILHLKLMFPGDREWRRAYKWWWRRRKISRPSLEDEFRFRSSKTGRPILAKVIRLTDSDHVYQQEASDSQPYEVDEEAETFRCATQHIAKGVCTHDAFTYQLRVGNSHNCVPRWPFRRWCHNRLCHARFCEEFYHSDCRK